MRIGAVTKLFVASVILTAVVLVPARRQDTALVFVSPTSKNVTPTGGNFTVTVQISNALNVQGFHVVFSLNNTVISYAGRTEGSFLRQGSNTTFFSSTPLPSPSVVRVTVDAGLLTGTPVGGSGTLFTITLAPVANGTSVLSLDSVTLRNPSNQPIPAKVTSGRVNVNNPIPVFVFPATKNVLPTAGSFDLNVNISNAAGVHGFHIVLNLNNAVIQYAASSEGSFLNAGGIYSTLFSFTPPGSGVTSVIVDDAILGPYAVSGDGTLFTITFAAVASGSTALTLSSIVLSDSNSNPIPAQLTSGTVNVNNPSAVYVDPTYSSGNQGGHDFGYDGFNTLADGLAAVTPAGTINIAPATYAGAFSVTKNVTLTPMSGTPVFQGLTLNTPAVSLGGNFQVSSTLTLTSGVLSTGPNAISVTNNASSSVAIGSGSVNGEVDRLIAGGPTGAYLFTDANTSLLPDGTQGPLSVSIRSFPGTTPPHVGSGTAVSRYYSIATSAALTSTVRLAYLDAEINGIPETSMTLFRSSGTIWVQVPSFPNPANNYVEASGVSPLGNWAIGDIDSPLPIQLASFTGIALTNGNVRLTWVTLSEINNYGFSVQRKRPIDPGYIDVPDGFVPGHGTTNEPHTYTFTDIAPGSGVWLYRLKQMDLDTSVYYTDPIEVNVVTSVTGNNQPPTFDLRQNYPNPFNPSTTIEFSLPTAGHTTLKIYNLLGEGVASLIDGFVAAGEHTVSWNASSLPSGIYLYKLTSGTFVRTMKLVLTK